MDTWYAKPNDVERKWLLMDASDKALGRLAADIARALRGKNKPQFTPNVDTGDFVVVVNSKKVKMTGQKWTQKKYFRHSRFFGSMKELSAQQMLEKDSRRLVMEAVRGMLPKNKLSYKLITKLKVYEDAEHPHAKQKPQART